MLNVGSETGWGDETRGLQPFSRRKAKGVVTHSLRRLPDQRRPSPPKSSWRAHLIRLHFSVEQPLQLVVAVLEQLAENGLLWLRGRHKRGAFAAPRAGGVQACEVYPAIHVHAARHEMTHMCSSFSWCCMQGKGCRLQLADPQAAAAGGARRQRAGGNRQWRRSRGTVQPGVPL